MVANTMTIDISQYLTEDHYKNLSEEAFNEIINILIDFINQGSIMLKEHRKELAWVCDAVMGSGKTTALEMVLKYIGDNYPNIPLLLIFNENSLMQRIYNSVYEYGKKKGIYNLIEYVQTENVNEVVHTLKNFQFVCITQQRFRDLSLGYGNWLDYKKYQIGVEPFHKNIDRLIIVDESPIFFDTCVFDISSKDNSVDWFDNMALEADLTPTEIQFGRTMIMLLMSYEMLDSEDDRSYTKALLNGIKDSKIQKRFEQILKKINTDKSDFESVRKYKWFKQLLYHDRIGVIDRHKFGVSIICSKFIPYHEKGNILILDGTAYWNDLIYKKGNYDLRHVTNHHNYTKRLKLWIRDINTSRESRDKKSHDIHGKITSDIRYLEDKLETKIFPLASKHDVAHYIHSGAISKEIKQMYELRSTTDDTLPINLLNTKGKEELSDYTSIALLNLPIRHPNFYKEIAVGLFGVDCNLNQNYKRQENENISWFKNEQVQEIFEKNLLADLLQIIHRTQLRKIKSSSIVHIILYTHLRGWGTKLQEAMGISKKFVFYDLVEDKYNFISKCESFAKTTRSFLEKHTDPFNTKRYTAGQIIKGDSFKNFIKKNWDNGYRTEKIKEIFYRYDIEITLEQKSNGQTWKFFSLTEEALQRLFP